MPDRIFYSVCFGFILGVLLRSFLLLNFYFILALAVLGAGLFLFFISVSKNQSGILFSILILAFCLGIFRFHLADQPAPDIFESQVGKKASFAGIIIDEPVRTEDNQKLTLEIDEDEKTKILAYLPVEDDYEYGDAIILKGELEKPENFITDQGKEFDYVNYLKKDGIFYAMYYPEVEIIDRGHGNPLKRLLFSVKNTFLEKINFAVQSPENALMGGLILGERASFSEEMRQNLINTGTVHIVALSGQNVTIVAEWIMKIFAFLPINFAFGAGILGILLFVVMSGGQSTAVRAGIMAVLALVARATGRNYDIARALLVVGVAMIAWNPFVLVHDVSFQLSFIATVAVIFLAPRVEKYFMWMPKKFGLREVISITFAAYIFVLPFILYKMGNLSLVALPANVFILPFIPITMVFGFLTGFAGLFHYTLAVPFGLISYLFLHYELGTIEFFSKIPFASLTIPNFPFWLVVLIYMYFTWRLFGSFLRPQPNLDSQKRLQHIFSSQK